MDGSVPGDAGPALAILEIQMLDIWAQPLPSAGTTLSVRVGGESVATNGSPIATVSLIQSGQYDITLESEGHVPLEIAATFDGSSSPGGLTVGSPVGNLPQGVSISHEMRTVGGRSIPVHTIHAGLRHRWFSAQGRPARRGNRVRLMANGEESFAQLATDLRTATDHVHAATWWWESDFELVRDEATHVTSTPEERQANTILGILDASPATKRTLVNQFLSSEGTWVSSDAPLRERGAMAGDNFEFMGQANMTRGMFEFQVAPFSFGDRVRSSFPEFASRTFDADAPIQSTVPSHPVDLTFDVSLLPTSLDFELASYHQKFFAIDGRVAFVGGLNLQSLYWDTNEHRVFEPRRMSFGSSTEDRMAVAAHEAQSDQSPLKDYMTRIEGPVVQDVEEMFHQRWATQLESGAVYAENSSDFEVIRDQVPYSDGVQAQLTATLPEPYREQAIAETWWNAISNAEEYIFVEDQYFRMPMLLDLIIERMTAVPTLELIVITNPIIDLPLIGEPDPGCEWTYQMSEAISTQFPDRYHLFQLRSFDIQEVALSVTDETESRFQDIYIHSKMFIVDDVFMSIGSANKNNRGIVYEGELNLAIYDRNWVEAERRRILALVLPPGITPADAASGASGWVAQLEAAADANQQVWNTWDAEGGDINLNGAPLPAQYTPAGFLYPLSFGAPSECSLGFFGPDMT
jgi:phosphatidylserine/phosphatidylglycerophosphate/cardiolipin synthase-like enzyme